jgi:hypothetical protein
MPISRRGAMTERHVIVGREQEGDAEQVDGTGRALGREIDLDAELLEHVRAAGAARDRPVAVLGDRHAARGRDERHRGRDVEGAGVVPAGAARVDERLPVRADRSDPAPHRLGESRDLLRRFALHAQRHRERGDLGGRRAAGQDLFHRGLSVGDLERVAVHRALDGSLDHARLPAR